MSKTAFLLAGQGAFRPGMFAAESAATDLGDLLDAADAVAASFGAPPVRRHLLDPAGPTAAELASADPFALQLVVFVAALGEYRLASRTEEPDVLVGHSLGELAALTAAGAFELSDALRVVCHRSAALAGAVTEPGGMLSVGMSAARTAHVVAAVDDPRAAIAVRNAPTRTVVAGPDAALESVRAVATALGAATVRLPAPYAYHSPGLALAAERFAESLAGVRQRPLRARVYSPLLGRYVADTDDLAAVLVRHLCSPVDFVAAVRDLHAEGLAAVVECGGGGLGKLITATVPGVSVGGAPAVVPAPEAAAVVEVVEAAPVTGPDVGEVTERLRVLYATALHYPLEAVDPEADLEAELGIDSLKRAEMLGKVGSEFRLPASVNDGRFLAHATLAELADMVAGTLAAEGAAR
ncbi:acyl transferase domain-containing protein/acyl carrier protein [Actinokineospora baliensis]|uniref:acyltransferase domain-containing protein n=1 Tax=Actinokineospora baliensis TaxID=547056 RepID=UPI001956190E|nr:acyltransferase domain-containing protein [Actinokineospora baliensis]MBM7774865.1 acyl transferase domain-containing protein/acyl carrier protein [Actinokineospora baliensis]